MKKQFEIRMIGMLMVLASLMGLYACNNDDDAPVVTFDAPVLSLSSPTTLALKPGAAIEATFSIEAEGGLKSIIVNRGGGFLEEIELDDQDASSFTYTGQTVPSDAAEGDEITYEFIGVNTQDTEAAPVSMAISVTVYDQTTVGGTALFNVTPTLPADGVVPAGTTVKFAANRAYYIGQPGTDVSEITFELGATLIIEEGATVYMQSGVDMEMTVFGTLDVQGTANNPVVMTSEHVLIADTDAEAGDWATFQIEGEGDGSNSGTFRYVRIEYAGDRAFILDNVGNGTTISHVQVWKCTDEGMFIGDGDVNLSHMVVTDSEDTQYRLDDAYKGNMQFILAVISLQDDGDESMYLRGDSRATISNVTVVGPGLIEGIGEPDGLRFWSTQGNKVYNAIVAELPSWGVRAEQSESDGRPAVTDINGPVVFAHSYVFNTEAQDEVTGNQGRDDGATFFTDASFNNSSDAVEGIGPLDFVPDSAPSSTFDPTTLGSFFRAASYAGAVENAANDWTTGWVKNPDGSLR